MDKSQIRTKKDDAKDAKVWALSEWSDQATHSRAPLKERLSILSKHTFALRIPLELDEDDHAHLNMEHLSCLR